PEVGELVKHFIENVEKTPQTPSNPANPQPVRNANPSQTPPNPVKPRTNSTSEKRSAQEFKVGDKVVVAGPAGMYKGACGEIVNICWTVAGQECRVQFDKEVRGSLRADIQARDLMNQPTKN
ncbi:hypothetical protein Q5691_27035, partial [Microcoleus sp. w1-18aA5]|uniref:hypothetical protein n=1 Tax=Microcoleus sp. w1-18aA5 TaxID=2818982 RepID=UPI002FD10103